MSRNNEAARRVGTRRLLRDQCFWCRAPLTDWPHPLNWQIPQKSDTTRGSRTNTNTREFKFFPPNNFRRFPRHFSKCQAPFTHMHVLGGSNFGLVLCTELHCFGPCKQKLSERESFGESLFALTDRPFMVIFHGDNSKRKPISDSFPGESNLRPTHCQWRRTGVLEASYQRTKRDHELSGSVLREYSDISTLLRKFKKRNEKPCLSCTRRFLSPWTCGYEHGTEVSSSCMHVCACTHLCVELHVCSCEGMSSAIRALNLVFFLQLWKTAKWGTHIRTVVLNLCNHIWQTKFIVKNKILFEFVQLCKMYFSLSEVPVLDICWSSFAGHIQKSIIASGTHFTIFVQALCFIWVLFLLIHNILLHLFATRRVTELHWEGQISEGRPGQIFAEAVTCRKKLEESLVTWKEFGPVANLSLFTFTFHPNRVQHARVWDHVCPAPDHRQSRRCICFDERTWEQQLTNLQLAAKVVARSYKRHWDHLTCRLKFQFAPKSATSQIISLRTKVHEILKIFYWPVRKQGNRSYSLISRQFFSASIEQLTALPKCIYLQERNGRL